MVRGRSETEHVLLWVSPYRLVSRMNGPFAVRDVALSQTLLLRAPVRGERQLVDTPFHQRGWSLADSLDPASLEVTVGRDSATWQIGAGQFAATLPTWSVRGAHENVDLDLELEALSPAFWFTDEEGTVEELGERWFVQCASARGRFGMGGPAFHRRAGLPRTACSLRASLRPSKAAFGSWRHLAQRRHRGHAGPGVYAA